MIDLNTDFVWGGKGSEHMETLQLSLHGHPAVLFMEMRGKWPRREQRGPYTHQISFVYARERQTGGGGGRHSTVGIAHTHI